MITKMDKYSFVLFHSDLSLFLKRVQELGMVDITRENKAIDDTSRELFSIIERYRKAIKGIETLNNTFSLPFTQSISLEESIKSITEPSELLSLSEKLITEYDQLKNEQDQVKRELSEAINWGILDKEDISKLSLLGYSIHLYSVSEKSYNPEWESNYVIHKLNTTNGKVYFALLHPQSEELNFKHTESKMPPRSCHLLESRLLQIESKLKEIEVTVAMVYLQREILERGLLLVREELELYLAGNSSVKEAEGTIALLTGFVPSEKRSETESFLQDTGVYYILEEAIIEDNPPVKLKNGFFASLYEPIGELYMLPKYGELDLTPYFAPFYMLFFGLCLGDMGYGLVMLTAATFAKFKFPKYKGYLTLIQFLGLGAILMAALSGVFFGTKIQDILNLPESVNELFFSDLKMFWFSIIFGLFQIVFARMVNAIYLMVNRGWQYGMQNIGWSIFIIWAAWYYATTMVPELSMPTFMHYVAIAGALMIFLFTSDSKKIHVRIFKGTLAFYDITSIFGDMLSYIRLFGLGTAGAILGMVVNSVAISMTGIPYLGWFFAGLMLVVGHLMVLLLSSLGAFVHPMRLTFVEFYKNASFNGGGRAFRPLTKDTK